MEIFKLIFISLGIIFICIVFVLLTTKLTILVTFSKKSDKKYVSYVTYMLFGSVIKIKKPISEDKKDETKDADFMDKVKEYYDILISLIDVYKKYSSKIYKGVLIKDIDISVDFGVNDAAKTATLAGAVWTGIYNIIAFVSNIVTITVPNVQVNPLYNELKCEADIKCVVKGRVYNLAILYLSYKWILYKSDKERKNNKKGGE